MSPVPAHTHRSVGALKAALLELIAGKVSKAGDTMTGPLVIEQAGTTAAQALLKVKAGPTGPTGTLRYVSPTSGFIFDIDGGTGTPSERPVLGVGDPTASTHAATKGYVDAIAGAGVQVLRGSTGRATAGAGETGQWADVTFSTPFASPPVVVVGLDSTAADGIGANVSADMITASGFRMRRMNSAGAVRTFGGQWIAIGPR